MQKSTNYGLNLPDLADQFNLNHWNENTEKLDLELKKETDSRINNDNQLQSNINNSVSTLRNEILTAETNAKNLANATGVLPIAKGGTGATDAKNGFMSLANGLVQSQNPQDAEYMIYKSSGNWGLYTLLQFWEYIKTKISSLLGLTATQYNGNAKTATKLATTRTINIQDASATNTGTGASFDGSGNATIKLPSTIKANITGNCSGSSGSCTGNSATATNANNAYRGMVHTCSTDVRTVAKTVSITGFTLTTGACIRVLFTNGNSVMRPTLNVNGTGAKEIHVIEGGTIKPLSSDYGSDKTGAYRWVQNTLLELYFDGNYWVAINNPIIAIKNSISIGNSSSAGSYKVYLNGFKEMLYNYHVGDLAKGETFTTKFTFAIPMKNIDYNVSLHLNQILDDDVESGAEFSTAHSLTYVRTLLYNRNSETTMKSIYLYCSIQGY